VPPRRRREQQGLERVLGAPALFATAYGNVGSSIYYALAATAATYAEGTVRYPEAGGSASFARHAFNELVSFGAAWAQFLNYVITIAISAFLHDRDAQDDNRRRQRRGDVARTPQSRSPRPPPRPTVDEVLRRAPIEVMVVAYPEGVLADEEGG
jgi:hypothetical protein